MIIYNVMLLLVFVYVFSEDLSSSGEHPFTRLCETGEYRMKFTDMVLLKNMLFC